MQAQQSMPVCGCMQPYRHMSWSTAHTWYLQPWCWQRLMSACLLFACCAILVLRTSACLAHTHHTGTHAVRLAWEALLFLQPGLWKSDSGKALLVQLLAARLEAAAFATVATDAERKRLVKMKASADGHGIRYSLQATGRSAAFQVPIQCVEFATTSSSSTAAWPWAADMEASSTPVMAQGLGLGPCLSAGNSGCQQLAEAMIGMLGVEGDERNFIMMRAVPGAAGGMAVAEPPPPLPADPAAGSSQAGCEGGEGSGPTGRGLSVSSLTPEQKAARLAELVEERVEQQLTLQRLMGKGNGTDGQGKKRSKVT
ncbi:hypothetical protein V8C86DRAFT_3023951 [Haematococcus lacustris]